MNYRKCDNFLLSVQVKISSDRKFSTSSARRAGARTVIYLSFALALRHFGDSNSESSVVAFTRL